MRRITEEEFLQAVREVKFYTYKQNLFLLKSLYTEHPDMEKIVESIKSLSFHNKNEKVFDRLFTTFENTILALYKIVKKFQKKGMITYQMYEEILSQEMQNFEKIEEITDKNLLKEKLNNFIVNDNQSFLVSFLYFLFPNIAKDSWDRSIGLIFFFRTKAIIKCFDKVYS